MVYVQCMFKAITTYILMPGAQLSSTGKSAQWKVTNY